MLTNSPPYVCLQQGKSVRARVFGKMRLRQLSFAAALVGGLFFVSLPSAFAQSQGGEQKNEQQQSAEEKAREAQMREAQSRAQRELSEAAKLPKNAGQPECLWMGRRVTSLLWRDDPEAARRFLELYERWGCPADHVKQAFRCLVRLGPIDQKAQQKLADRVHLCWVRPDTLAP
ncbi:MAG TPA: hypothetical protein VNQ34_08950 [Xanthobacteraceae bacterium]|jgi:hypothetical protein|nr:hypothetical protein [Xanthobacteraceae bacterium]